MAGFKFSINVEPGDIPRLDDAHKRDCADVLTSAVNSTLKYTLIMSGTILALFAAYSFFNFIWMLRMHYMLPRVSGIVPLAAVVIFVFEFVSGTMKGWALALQTFFHLVILFAAVTSVPSLVTAPFIIYGAVLHFKLITLLPWHKAISREPGYPEFTPLPERKQSSPEKKEEDIQKAENEKEPDATESPAEKQEDTEKEEKAEKTEKTAPAEGSPEVNRPTGEEKQEIAGKPSGGNGKKKHKRRKGKK